VVAVTAVAEFLLYFMLKKSLRKYYTYVYFRAILDVQEGKINWQLK
jgi:hypothetical protein